MSGFLLFIKIKVMGSRVFICHGLLVYTDGNKRL
jgi:hypothetical protein